MFGFFDVLPIKNQTVHVINSWTDNISDAQALNKERRYEYSMAFFVFLRWDAFNTNRGPSWIIVRQREQ